MSQAISLQDEAYNYLSKLIAEGFFKKGKIYSLNAITGMLQMSKTPVRDALRKLSQEELVEILPSRGFRLQRISEREIIELYQLRCAIEGYCCYSLALECKANPNCTEIERLNENIDKQKSAIKSNVPSGSFLPIDREFHRIITSSVKNKRFDFIMENNRDRISGFVLRSLEAKGVLDITLREHQAIVNAIRFKDPIEAQKAMLTHLDTPLRANLVGHTGCIKQETAG